MLIEKVGPKRFGEKATLISMPLGRQKKQTRKPNGRNCIDGNGL
jgi:hypothetical protein